MSRIHTEKAWAANVPALSKIVLVAAAEASNNLGQITESQITDLGAKCCMSCLTVITHLHFLEAVGMVAPLHRQDGEQVGYTLTLH